MSDLRDDYDDRCKNPAKPPEVWIDKGIVTDPSDYTDSPEITHTRDRLHDKVPVLPKVGDPEWRVYADDPTDSSGPELIGQHLSLEAAIALHSGSVVHLTSEPPEDLLLYERWTALRDTYSPTDILERVRDAAFQQGILGTLLDAMEARQ